MFSRLIRAVLIGSLVASTSAVIGAAVAKRRIPSVGTEEDNEIGVRAIFGGVADGRPTVERAPDAPRLVIEGLTLFGGLAIFSSMPEVEALGVDGATD